MSSVLRTTMVLSIGDGAFSQLEKVTALEKALEKRHSPACPLHGPPEDTDKLLIFPRLAPAVVHL